MRMELIGDRLSGEWILRMLALPAAPRPFGKRRTRVLSAHDSKPYDLIGLPLALCMAANLPLVPFTFGVLLAVTT